MSKNVYQHLEDLTGEKQATVDYSRLASKFAGVVTELKEEDLQKEAAYENGKELNERHIDWMRKVVAEELEKEVDRVDGSLPVSSVFEAYQQAKSAAKHAPRDLGVRILTTHLEKLWKRDRTANLTVSDMLKVKDHYNRNYPKSAASNLIEDISSNGYFMLPVEDLVHVASQIRTQEDYDYYIKEAGLAGGNPFQKKSRNFILALINGEPEAHKTAEMLINADEDGSW